MARGGRARTAHPNQVTSPAPAGRLDPPDPPRVQHPIPDPRAADRPRRTIVDTGGTSTRARHGVADPPAARSPAQGSLAKKGELESSLSRCIESSRAQARTRQTYTGVSPFRGTGAMSLRMSPDPPNRPADGPSPLRARRPAVAPCPVVRATDLSTAPSANVRGRVQILSPRLKKPPIPKAYADGSAASSFWPLRA